MKNMLVEADSLHIKVH